MVIRFLEPTIKDTAPLAEPLLTVLVPTRIVAPGVVVEGVTVTLLMLLSTRAV